MIKLTFLFSLIENWIFMKTIGVASWWQSMLIRNVGGYAKSLISCLRTSPSLLQKLTDSAVISYIIKEFMY